MTTHEFPRTEDEIFEDLASTLLVEEDDANPRAPNTYTNALLRAHAATLAENQEQSLDHTYNSAYVVDATGEELTKKARNLGVIRQSAVRATGVVTFSRDSAATSDHTIPSGTVVETLETDPTQFETTETVTLSNGTTSVKANIRALDGGSDGNVGPNAIQSMPSLLTGIDSVTNTQATGDPTLTDENGDPLVAGQDRESDDELRERVLNTDAVQEGPSGNGVRLALADVTGLVSSHINTNQESSTVDGIDPYNSEIIVFGGDVADVAQTLYETMSVTTLLRLQGGVNGTKETSDVYSELLDQTVTVPITRPTELTFDLEVDVVHTNAYPGDDTVKDAIVNYVGGTLIDNSTAIGTTIGENVMVNEIEKNAEDVDGVDFADVTLLDTDNDGADDTTTDSDGVPILSVSNSEVARLDADNITLSTTVR